MKCSFPERSFDALGFTRELSGNVAKLKEALAREFIRTALSGIPVWSGASQATLIPLAQLVRETEAIPAKPIRTAKKDAYHGIEAGISHGKGALTPTGFTFSHDLRQFLEQEWGERAINSASARVSDMMSAEARKVIPSWLKYFYLRGK
jgi:hypothetical protein